ncbi:hypothetical protein [Criblamydia sequanensis]|uniref:Secreted protein n=1 Tax=Candidatus Criblamydia sequanensis CRIB-18 TaxID=1437425 RepID=A0A090CZQ3_9BACT|nr:hypothetical protein [Criblamydia sequanensis]CDR34451.1 putative secreted protein [Criblamydia sequanensis CRIB-18]
MKHNLLILFAVSFIFVSHLCISEDELEYIALAQDMNNRFVNEVQNKYGLLLYGSGVKMLYHTKDSIVNFSHHGVLSRNELRRLLIEISMKYINEINNNVELIPYLDNSPFLPENLTLNIYPTSQEGKQLFYPDYCAGEMYKGNLYFVAEDELNPFGPAKVDEKESYDQACQIVFHQSKIK